jgi:hypothetical protein
MFKRNNPDQTTNPGITLLKRYKSTLNDDVIKPGSDAT